MKEKLIVLGLFVAAATLAAFNTSGPEPEPKPATTATPVVGPPPESGAVGPPIVSLACGCGGKCECANCECKTPGECLLPKAQTPSEQPCPICKGVGATRENGQWVKCAICGGDGTIDNDPRDPESQPGFQPTLYTKPQPAPVAVQSYSSCANGSCGSSGPLRRLFGRRR